MSDEYILEISKLSKSKKEWLANAICGIVCSDGVIDQVELAFLKKALGFIGEKDTVIKMVQTVKEKKVPELQNLKDITRAEAFKIYLFIGKLALSDARLTIDEVDFLRKIGSTLGFPSVICEKLNHIMMQARNIIREEEEKDFEKNKDWLHQIELLQEMALNTEPVWPPE